MKYYKEFITDICWLHVIKGVGCHKLIYKVIFKIRLRINMWKSIIIWSMLSGSPDFSERMYKRIRLNLQYLSRSLCTLYYEFSVPFWILNAAISSAYSVYTTKILRKYGFLMICVISPCWGFVWDTDASDAGVWRKECSTWIWPTGLPW